MLGWKCPLPVWVAPPGRCLQWVWGKGFLLLVPTCGGCTRSVEAWRVALGPWLRSWELGPSNPQVWAWVPLASPTFCIKGQSHRVPVCLGVFVLNSPWVPLLSSEGSEKGSLVSPGCG